MNMQSRSGHCAPRLIIGNQTHRQLPKSWVVARFEINRFFELHERCLLYTSDAADE